MANNCKAVFVNNTPLVCTVTDNGDGTYTFNNHIDPPITWSTGGADTDTSIVFNQVLPNGNWEFNVVDVLTNTVLTTFTVPAPTISIIDNGDNTFTYIDVAGNPTVISYEHTLVDNNDGTFTFTQPDGTPITIDVCKLQQDSGCAATMVDNGDGTYTYTDINGVSTTFTGGIANVLTTITNTVTGHKIADYTDENGGVTTIYETISTLINNGDGTATFTNEDGTAITFPIGGVSIVDNTDGTYLVTLADGSTITIGDTSISTLVDNGDNTYTYTDETGVVTTFDVTGVLTTVTNTIVGNKIADYTDEAGGVTPIYESITSFASITNGWQFTSEDGTVTTVAYLFDNATPSTPNLLVQVNGTTQASIPLNSYDVNITTSGGFTFNPTTDQITITETDGETHVIDLTPLRTTLTSVDNSVQIVSSVNPDGSTNYDLSVGVPNAHIVATTSYDPLNPLTGWVAPTNPIEGNTVTAQYLDGTVVHYTYDGVAWVVDFVEAPVVSIVHSNETQAIPYTGVELPTTPGINIGDTDSTQFSDGTVANYTYDGTVWVLDFATTPETTGTITIIDEDSNTFIQDNNADAVFPLHRSLHVSQGTVGGKAIGSSHSDSDQLNTGDLINNHTNVVIGSSIAAAAGENTAVIASNLYSRAYGNQTFLAACSNSTLLNNDSKISMLSSQNVYSAGNNRWSSHISGSYNTWSNFRNSVISGTSNIYNNVTDGSLVSGFANVQNAGQIQSSSIFCRYTKFNSSVGGSLILGGGVASRENEINGSMGGSIFIGATDGLATLPTKVDNVAGSIIQVTDSRHIGSFQQGILNAYKSEINSPVSQYSLIQLADSNISGSNYSAFIFGQNINSTGNINQSSVIGRNHTVNSNIFNSFISGSNTSINHSEVFVYNNTSSILTTDDVSKGFLGLINGMDIYSNDALSLGVSLASGGTSWASISDKNKKTNFEKIDYKKTLDKFSKIDITKWNYKDSDTKHIGIMAQDFYKVVGQEIGSDNKKIETIDADGLSLILIKALYLEIENLKSEINSLKSK